MRFTLKLANNKDATAKKPLIMAVFNATPDSFSDGGELENESDLNKRIEQVIAEGADIIDVGGESTRPGFKTIDEKTEIKRVVPVIRSIRSISKIPISIDTQKAIVAEAAIQTGADFINDISSLSDPKMHQVVNQYDCSVILMRGKALSGNLILDCKDKFAQIIKNAESKEISRDQIILDPGLGFGDLKTKDFSVLPGSDVKANLELINSVRDYSLGFPILIGGSRKRFIGEMMNEPDPKKRVSGSVEIAISAAKAGASILRVHDVKETLEGLRQAGLRA